ncbi:MAG: ATP-dependent DNA helicase [Deltaproteobacteria bacterium]|nr:ATP-dependent DNA helicase [Deltaproteobacteria bacterium]
MRLESAAADILRPRGALAEVLPGFEPRPGQVAMARRVARAIELDERLLVEAGTGTGKTIAYLVPAILSGRRVVVSTGTRTLQDQIASLDLPRLQRVLAQPFSYAVMKGIGNYVCRRRLAEHHRQLALATTAAPETARVLAWAERSRTGDRAELDGVPEDAAIWRDIAASPETRLGKRCPFVADCFVTAMRKRAQEAQVVVVNHHLFFADLALRTRFPEAQVLPGYDAVIFDEAHQLEDIATEIFGVHVTTLRLFALARDVERAPAGRLGADQVDSMARRLEASTHLLGQALRARLPRKANEGDDVRAPMPDDLWQGEVLARYHELDTVLEEAEVTLARFAEDDGSDVLGASAPAPGKAAVLEGLASRAAILRADLGEIADSASRDSVRWVALSSRNVSLRASPVDVAPILAESFSRHAGPLIFTSATLSTVGSFSYVRERLGLADTAAEAVFASPFRFDLQALLYIAEDLPDPTHESFAAAAAERALALCRLSHGRALLLFTSFRNLRVAEEVFRARDEFPLLVQGQRPRQALLDELRTRVGSVLLATQSFWEGVDVPGEALSLVVMDRLPFSVPDDPLTAARIERIRENGGDAFGSYQIPRAALALKQGFGRLIRSRRDRGVVAILDGRIARKSYGAALLGSLPEDCPRTHALDEVRAFF